MATSQTNPCHWAENTRLLARVMYCCGLGGIPELPVATVPLILKEEVEPLNRANEKYEVAANAGVALWTDVLAPPCINQAPKYPNVQTFWSLLSYMMREPTADVLTPTNTIVRGCGWVTARA